MFRISQIHKALFSEGATLHPPSLKHLFVNKTSTFNKVRLDEMFKTRTLQKWTPKQKPVLSCLIWKKIPILEYSWSIKITKEEYNDLDIFDPYWISRKLTSNLHELYRL